MSGPFPDGVNVIYSRYNSAIERNRARLNEASKSALVVQDLAISVHAPWAWALMYAGKDVENRGPRFPRKVLGRVWVHASLWPGTLSRSDDWWAEVRSVARCSVPISEQRERAMWKARGHVVGSIEVGGYQTPNDPPDSRWYVPGSLAILVRDPVPLAHPVPTKGALGWWKPKGETLEALRRASVSTSQARK